MYMSVQVFRDQRYRMPLKLELQAIVSFLMWVLGTKLKSSPRQAHSLISWTTASIPIVELFEFIFHLIIESVVYNSIFACGRMWPQLIMW